jgi:hypothetical protein
MIDEIITNKYKDKKNSLLNNHFMFINSEGKNNGAVKDIYNNLVENANGDPSSKNKKKITFEEKEELM